MINDDDLKKKLHEAYLSLMFVHIPKQDRLFADIINDLSVYTFNDLKEEYEHMITGGDLESYYGYELEEGEEYPDWLDFALDPPDGYPSFQEVIKITPKEIKDAAKKFGVTVKQLKEKLAKDKVKPDDDEHYYYFF